VDNKFHFERKCLFILNKLLPIADYYIMKICFRWKAVKSLTHFIYMDYCIKGKKIVFINLLISHLTCSFHLKVLYHEYNQNTLN